MVDERPLKWMKGVSVTLQPFDRRYLFPVGMGGKIETCVDRPPIDDHRAGATIARVATPLGSSHFELIPQQVQQGSLRFDLQPVGNSVYLNLNGFGLRLFSITSIHEGEIQRFRFFRNHKTKFLV
jgi:hypothetical protein